MVTNTPASKETKALQHSSHTSAYLASNKAMRHDAKKIAMLVALTLSVSSSTLFAADVYRCNEPKGISMFSVQGHKPGRDGYSGVHPIAIIDGNTMTVIWGNAKSAGGADLVWKAAVFYQDSDTVNAVTYDAGPAGSAAMLYTMDTKRGFLYLSQHKNNLELDGSIASSFVASCNHQ